MADLIDRQAAIDALKKHEIELPIYSPRETDVFWNDAIDCCVSELEDLPPAQPEMDEVLKILEMAKDKNGEVPMRLVRQAFEKLSEHCADTISRQAAIDALGDMVMNWTDSEYELGQLNQWKEDRKAIIDLPSAQPQWISVTERLPEEDVEVLITYRHKEGEGDTSHAYIDITTYGQMYFGGNKVGDHKHWRQPFEYFTSNYEVVAWMPLPKPYKGGQDALN